MPDPVLVQLGIKQRRQHSSWLSVHIFIEFEYVSQSPGLSSLMYNVRGSLDKIHGQNLSSGIVYLAWTFFYYCHQLKVMRCPLKNWYVRLFLKSWEIWQHWAPMPTTQQKYGAEKQLLLWTEHGYLLLPHLLRALPALFPLGSLLALLSIGICDL